MSILDELHWRGLVADCTDLESLGRRLREGPIAVYAGFEPSADSLHVGHLVPLLVLRRFQLQGHRPIALAGGATGLIGDPSGKADERKLLSPEEIEANVAGISAQLRRFLDFDGPNPALLLNNASWFAPMTCLAFLRDIGKHFTVNTMVAKESVRSRMEDREVGISYTEFSYMLLQAYDFLHLLENGDCQLQIGGSDQWGNITAGIDLARRKGHRQLWGLTVPLVTKADGSKMGKTESGAVWLDGRRTSPYKFYQYWINVEDADVIRLLKYYSFLPQERVEALRIATETTPERREAQRVLAMDLTTLIHGSTAAEEAELASQALFGGSLDGITEALFHELAGEIPTCPLPALAASEAGAPLVDLLVDAALCPSKGQARKDIAGGGIYVNNRREADVARLIRSGDLVHGRHLLLRKGRRNYALLTRHSA